MPGKLRDKVAIVTGGGDGIGAAIVKRLLTEGCRVLTCDLSAIKLERMHERSPTLLLFEQDVTTADAADRLVSTALSHFGYLDILINNAGANHSVELEHASDDEWYFHFQVNLNAIFRMCRRAVPALRQRSGGRIINIASISAVRPAPGLGPYAAAKAGLISMTRSLAVELGSEGITANCILPGPTRTGIARAKFAVEPQLEKLLAGKTALARIAEPEEIAGGALFLASQDASYITGHALVIDGGSLAKA